MEEELQITFVRQRKCSHQNLWTLLRQYLEFGKHFHKFKFGVSIPMNFLTFI